MGQDEAQLARRIGDLLAAGTTQIWVVRLTDPRHVEIHAPGAEVRVAWPGERLTAPGVLKNPVLVEALYDRAAAQRMTLGNLLQREGYDSLEAVQSEARLVPAGLWPGHVRHGSVSLSGKRESAGMKPLPILRAPAASFPDPPDASSLPP